jgi:hypothetical protein
MFFPLLKGLTLWTGGLLSFSKLDISFSLQVFAMTEEKTAVIFLRTTDPSSLASLMTWYL